MKPILFLLPFFEYLSMPLLASISAILELGSAILLLFSKTSKYGAYILVAMHILILLTLGPIGLSQNSVIWSWNICSALLIPILFLKRLPKFTPSQIVIPKNFYHAIVILLLLILPSLNFLNLWDHYPSASLYSGKKPYAKIHLTDQVKEKFPNEVAKKISLLNELSIRKWSYVELNVPDYPQQRIYQHVFSELCNYQEKRYGLVLETYSQANILTGKRARQEHFCHEL